MTTVTEDATRYPRFISEHWEQFVTRRPVKSARYIKPTSPAGQEVIARSGRTYDAWGRLVEVTSNTITVESHDYSAVPAAGSTRLYSHTVTDHTGQKTLVWRDYLDREVQRVEYILPGVAYSPPECAKYETVTNTVFSPRTTGGRTTTVTTNSRYLGGALAGENRTSSLETDRSGRRRFSTSVTGEELTYKYDGLTTTVEGLVLNAAGTGSTVGIHRREIRYRDGRPAQVYGAKVSPQWYDYGVDDEFAALQTVTSATASSASGKFATSLPTADTATAVTTLSDGLGRTYTETRRHAPGLNPISLSTSYGDEGRLLYQEERTTGEGNTALKRYRKQALTWDSGVGEWTSTSSYTLVNGATTTEHYPTETLTRYAKINYRWTSITRTRRKDASGNWEVLSSRHEQIGPWPISGPGGSLEWDNNKAWRGSNLDGSGTPAGASVTYIWRDRAKIRTETTTSDCITSSSAISWNGLLYEGYEGTSDALTLYDYTGLRELKAVRDPRLWTWSLTTVQSSTGRQTGYRGPGHTTDEVAYTYYPATDWRSGLVFSVTNAASEVTYNSYDDAGRTTHTWGTAGYPSHYTYDARGRLTQLRTYRGGSTWNDADLADAGFDGTADLTQWTYDNPTGLLNAKVYNDTKDTAYTHHRDGSLNTRQWARGVNGGTASESNPRLSTTYGWTGLGEMASVNYNDATPDVAFTYNSHNGSTATMSDGTGTRTYTFKTNGRMDYESIAFSDSTTGYIDPAWDSENRRQSLTASVSSQTTTQQVWSYSNKGRLSLITAGTRSVGFGYHDARNDVNLRLYKVGTNQVMETIETLDTKNRIWKMTNRRSDATGAPVFASHTYTFDSADRRDTATREDTTYWDYDYADRGQVTAARKKLSSGTLLAGTESTYAYDDIGNRETWTSGGGPATASGTPSPVSRTVTYTANALNQYTALAYDTRSFDVIGRAATTDTVTVNAASPYEQLIVGIGDQFRASITAVSGTNTTGGYENVNVQTGAGTVLEYSGLKWVPATTTSPTYDHDGNLKTSGRWTYYWDAENRLIRASRAANTAAGLIALNVAFTYDAYSRRTGKLVSTYVHTGNSSVVTEILRERYLYDGWNLMGAWRGTPTTSAPYWIWTLHQSYIWGPDVSGSAQGAGGVGGLLMILDASQTNGGWFPCYDGNGNVMALVDAVASGTASAIYEYDAFGNPLRMSGTAAKLNPFRFSTKFTDDETELVYYGYRYYDAAPGRWLSRDPLGEEGGLGLYGGLMNQPTNRVDILGRDLWNPSADDTSLKRPSLTPTVVPPKATLEDDGVNLDGWCGKFSWRIKWSVDTPSDSQNGGQILQDVEQTVKVYKCGDPQLDKARSRTIKYSEVWQVAPGTTNVVGPQRILGGDAISTDNFGSDGAGSGTCGTIEIKGYARYYSNQKDPPIDWPIPPLDPNMWYPGEVNNLPSGTLFANKKNPRWKKPYGTTSTLRTRIIKVKWNCCPNEHRKTEVVHKAIF